MSRLARACVAALAARGWRVAFAESLTGGLIAAEVVSVSGASRVFPGGVVSYAPEVKASVLGVPQSVIDADGVVSAACARAMAKGARALMGADVAVSATGVAGPTGGTAEAPVGTVWIGVSRADGETAVCRHFRGGRAGVRKKAARAALRALLDAARGRER